MNIFQLAVTYPFGAGEGTAEIDYFPLIVLCAVTLAVVVALVFAARTARDGLRWTDIDPSAGNSSGKAESSKQR